MPGASGKGAHGRRRRPASKSVPHPFQLPLTFFRVRQRSVTGMSNDQAITAEVIDPAFSLHPVELMVSSDVAVPSLSGFSPVLDQSVHGIPAPSPDERPRLRRPRTRTFTKLHFDSFVVALTHASSSAHLGSSPHVLRTRPRTSDLSAEWPPQAASTLKVPMGFPNICS